MSDSSLSLHPDHLADLRMSGLTDETITVMGVHSVPPADIPKLMGFDPQGVESALRFPYLNTPEFFRLKLFPSMKGLKYWQPSGSGVHPYLLPGIAEKLKDPTIPLYWTEGEKKAARAWQAELPAVGLGGLWNWLENKHPASWLETIAHAKREEIIVPDSDVWTRPDLLKPIYAFGMTLEEFGATVCVAILPPRKDANKRGLDDFLIEFGAEILERVNRIPLRHKTFTHTESWYEGWKKRKELVSLPTPTCTPAELEAAQALLVDSKLLDRFLADVERVGCVGETNNKLTVFLTCLSAQLENPISIEVRGESAGGKNTLVERVAAFFPPENILSISYMSARALLYLRDRDTAHKVLFIAERAGGESADYSLRTMQSEKKLVVWVAERKEGKIATTEVEIQGPIAVIETTTQTQIDPQNASRAFEIFVDETEDQTDRIFKAQDQAALGEVLDQSTIIRPWQVAIKQLKPCRVVIPFVSLIAFPQKPLRVRRDRQRFLTLIQTSAFVHQKQRRWKTPDTVEASVFDYAVAYALTKNLLQQIVRGVNPKLQQLLAAAKKLQPSAFKASDLEKELKWNRSTVNRWAKAAESNGLFEKVDGGKGKPTEWELGQLVEETQIPLLTPDELAERLRTCAPAQGCAEPSE